MMLMSQITPVWNSFCFDTCCISLRAWFFVSSFTSITGQFFSNQAWAKSSSQVARFVLSLLRHCEMKIKESSDRVPLNFFNFATSLTMERNTFSLLRPVKGSVPVKQK